MRQIACLICASLLLSACSMPRFSLPRVHKVTVQQGNVITQDMIDQLKPGMTRGQVAYIMGDPVFRNAFNDNRWDYIYSIEVPGYYEDKKMVSLFFENDLLAYFTGDYTPSENSEEAEPAAEAEAEAAVSTL
jgi:outer membrane protein assembly factor BamE